MIKKQVRIILALVLILIVLSCSNHDATLYGTWTFNKEKSTDLASWRYRQLEVTIKKANDDVTVIHNWTHRRYSAFVDSVTFTPGGEMTQITVNSPIWPVNWFIGVLAKTNSMKTIIGQWKVPDKELITETEQVILISQGETTIKTIREYSINDDGNVLIIKENYASRPTPITLVFDRVQVPKS